MSQIRQLYAAIEHVAEREGYRRLADLTSLTVPRHGVYLFFEDGESRRESGNGLRVVRVGTHALSATSKASLWSRLKQHRGVSSTGSGNHRGSIFRLLVGEAMLNKEEQQLLSWGVGMSASHEVRSGEIAMETRVTTYLARMFVIVCEVPERTARAALELSAIALLSNYRKTPIDAPSPGWLGQFSEREKVRESGLWNNQGVDKNWDPLALELLK